MCTGTESRGIIKGCDPLIFGKDGDIEDYHNNNNNNSNNNNNNSNNNSNNNEATTMRDNRDYCHKLLRLCCAAFIHFLQWLLKLPSNALQLPTLPLSEVVEELKSLVKIAGPIIMTSFLIYSRSVISMLFLGRLGKTELAGGSLALGFGNITGYSILRGLSTGMDPICCQAYGAKRMSVLSQTFQKTVCLLLLVSIPISILWLNMETIFTWLGQDPAITKVAKLYLAFSIPELLCQVHLQPLRIFMRTQGLTVPLTVAATCSAILHLPINYLLVTYFKLGVGGVALALGWNTLNLNVGLLLYIVASNKPLKPWQGISNLLSVFQGWKPLLSLALPSCLSICLEWWWYEIIVFLCGLLRNPETTIGAMGILIQTTGMLYVFPISLSAALTTRVGYALGAGQPTRAQWTAILGIIVAFVFGIFALVFTTTMRSKWGKIYTDERNILDLVSKTLPILGLCELANTPQTTACGVLNGTARPKLGAKINLYAFYLVGLPVAILATFTFKIGFLGLWYGLLSAQLSCLCMLLYTLLQTDWNQQSMRAGELTMTTEEKEKELEKVVVVVEEEEEKDEQSAPRFFN